MTAMIWRWCHRMVLMLGALIVAGIGGGAAAQGGREVKVAVAANFTEPAKELAAVFEKATGHKLVLSFGATGQFYAQIVNGAPFEVFVAADKAAPTKAVAEGHAVAGTQFTYAVGKLVLYSKVLDVTEGGEVLKKGSFNKLAIAHPAAAPYGAAAVETIAALGVRERVQARIVQGNNIAQTLQFVETGNAELGFVALSQIVLTKGGARWVVPDGLHAPISQDAVLLRAGAGNPAARAFLDFLRGPEARAVIEKYGYGLVQ